MDRDKALEGDGGVAGTLEAIHESIDGCGGGGARAMAKGEDGVDVFVVGWGEGVVGGGAEERETEREVTGFGKQGCSALGDLVLD